MGAGDIAVQKKFLPSWRLHFPKEQTQATPLTSKSQDYNEVSGSPIQRAFCCPALMIRIEQ